MKKLKLLIFIILIFYYLRSCNVRSSIYPFLFSQTPFFEDLFPTRILHIILKYSYIYPHPPSHFLHPASGNRTFLPAETYVSRLKSLRFRPAKRRKQEASLRLCPCLFKTTRPYFHPAPLHLTTCTTFPLPHFRNYTFFRIFALDSQYYFMKYKLLALDLDGTLTNSKKVITPRTRETLLKAQEKGVKIILASGRPTYGIVPLAEQLELQKYEGYILAYNGGEITDWKTKEVICKNLLDPEVLPYLYECAKKNDFAIVTYDGEYVLTEKPDDEYVLKEALLNVMKIKKVDNFLEAVKHPIAKCLIVGDPTRLAVLEKEMYDHLKDRMGVFRSEPYFLELVPKGIDKALSLAGMLEKIGVSREEMIAIGDGFNDLSMIKYAGLGIAMANAQDVVKENADFITLSNEEDGVAYAAEKFILS